MIYIMYDKARETHYRTKDRARGPATTLQTFLPWTAARLCFNQRIKPPPAFQTLKDHFHKLAARVELRSAMCQKKIDVECELKRKKLGDIM